MECGACVIGNPADRPRGGRLATHDHRDYARARLRTRRASAVLGLAALAIALLAWPASAAPTAIPSKFQLRGHLPELGEEPALRAFLTVTAYDSYRNSLGGANVFPPASALFMSFDRDILALYIRGNDSGGRCLRTGPNATLDADTTTADLSWETGTCGAPISAHYPFILVSLSRTAADGASWIQAGRSVCASAPGVDGSRACAALASTSSPAPTGSPGVTPVPTAAPSVAPAPSVTAAPTATATRTAAPASSAPPTPSLVTAASPTVVASPVAAASPPPSAESGGGPNLLLVAALIGLGFLIGLALMAARRPSPRR